MYKLTSTLCISALLLSGCTSLTYQEQQDLTNLQYQGITIDRAPGGWQQPASPLTAGLLNILPGIGNFYLASGNAGDSSHWIFGFLNLITWPISPIWAVPEAAIDATNINKRDMLNFYKYGNQSSSFVPQPYQPQYRQPQQAPRVKQRYPQYNQPQQPQYNQPIQQQEYRYNQNYQSYSY